jgi:hypothetical protein
VLASLSPAVFIRLSCVRYPFSRPGNKARVILKPSETTIVEHTVDPFYFFVAAAVAAAAVGLVNFQLLRLVG